MPRNPQGLYTLPAGNPVVPNTLIESAWANTTMDDVATALTNSLPRDGSAPMTGPLTLQAAPPTQPRHAISKGYLESFLAYATGMPIGSLLPVAGSTIPSGFLLCDGQAVSRTTYPDLFASIGTIYGSGDGSSTFNVPDMRDWFVRGKSDSRPVGSQQAASFANHTHAFSDPGHIHTQAAHSHTLTIPPHNHTLTDPGHDHDISVFREPGSNAYTAGVGVVAQVVQTEPSLTGVSIAPAATPGTANSQQPAIDSAVTGASIGVAGGAETVPQNIAMNYVIKAVNDPGSTVALTGITSSDINMIDISTTNPVVPELVIKSNVAFGTVKLDASGKVPISQMQLTSSALLGFFDASGGQNPTEAYPSETFLNGDEYVISVAGTINVLDPVTLVSSPTLVAVGSTLLYITGSTSSPTGWYTIVAAAATNASAVNFLPEGTIGATNVQSAIAELDSETQTALSGKAPSSAATATGTSFTPAGGIIAGNVQAAIEELDAEKVSTANLIAANVAYTPFGNVAATNVQNAINELDTEKAPLVSPAFTGSPTAPTAAPGDNDTSIATTAFVAAAIAVGGTQEAFRATSNASQTITTGVAAKVLFQTEDFDANASYNPTLARYTPKIAGYYQVNGQVLMGNSTVSLLSLSIRKNGAPVQQFRGFVDPTLSLNTSISGVLQMNGTTDYIEIWCEQNTGGNLAVIPPDTWFSAARVG